MSNNATGERFYFLMGLILIAFLIAGFTPFIYNRISQEGEISLTLVLHGIVYLSWYCLFVFQASLIAHRKIALHIKLGKASLYLAGAILITGFLMMKNAFDQGSTGGTPFTAEHFILLPVMDLILFSIGYTLAYRNRKTASSHKHYMLITSILIMDPATARLAMTLGFMPLGILFHFGFMIALVIYDKKHNGKIHKATLIGLSLLIARYFSFFVIGPTETWSKLIHLILG